ncbi:hypothetical protein [Aureitalea marina]|uniref:Uncharacterized protein n=1 Tax=Aureitalea marina TaxID=930804 RepID=A0A2S7KTJ1_9FLAO|nr:hypothetical protein [Aureitalea marina]PQB05878.1 hypothetical protein BST85_13950 [Aureitalea marina]
MLKHVVAAIGPNCTDNINYEDDDGNVYAYRADNIFGVVSIQVGGHSTPDESTDPGVNLYGANPVFGLPDTGTYSVTDGSLEPGTGYVFYIDGTNEYISTRNNQGKPIRIDQLTLTPEGEVSQFTVTFSNLELANNSDPDDKICVNAFQLSFSAN